MVVNAWDFWALRARVGLRGLVGGIGYKRSIEYPWAFEALKLRRAATLLDVGSERSPFPAFCLTRVPGARAATVDLDVTIRAQTPIVRRLHLADRVLISQQDATRLAFGDGTFEAVSCISVLEHLPGEGDQEALREMARVLAPGGRLVVTVDAAACYREHFRAGPVYARRFGGVPIFYAREYDQEALAQRLLAVVPYRLVEVVTWCEAPVGWSRLMTAPRLKYLMVPLRALNPLLARCWFCPRDLAPATWVPSITGIVWEREL